jgi:hypothetical protein
MTGGHHNVIRGSVFRHERRGAGVQCTEELVIAGVHGQNNDPQVGVLLACSADCIKATSVRQAYVEDHDPGLELGEGGICLSDRTRLTDNLEVRRTVECPAEAVADELMVVHQ